MINNTGIITQSKVRLNWDLRTSWELNCHSLPLILGAGVPGSPPGNDRSLNCDARLGVVVR